MSYREVIAVCSEIHTKHTNTLCGQNVEFVSVKLTVHVVTTGLYKVNVVGRLTDSQGISTVTGSFRSSYVYRKWLILL